MLPLNRMICMWLQTLERHQSLPSKGFTHHDGVTSATYTHVAGKWNKSGRYWASRKCRTKKPGNGLRSSPHNRYRVIQKRNSTQPTVAMHTCHNLTLRTKTAGDVRNRAQNCRIPVKTRNPEENFHQPTLQAVVVLLLSNFCELLPSTSS